MLKIISAFFFFNSILFANEVVLLHSNWKFRNSNNLTWINAKVPGTVHTDLLTNKIIPDPFYAENESKLQWIENEDWVYETYFDIPENSLLNDNIELIFEGLDTYTTVKLNDSLILQSVNMFRIYKINVKQLLVPKNNKLTIYFESSIKNGKISASKLNYKLPGGEKVFTRKAQYQYGWDWGPRFVTCGIWKPVKLFFYNNATIENYFIEQTKLNSEKGELKFNLNINCATEGNYEVRISHSLIDEDLFLKIKNWFINIIGFSEYSKSKKFYLKKGANAISMQYSIDKPQYWWTNGLGKQNLYEFKTKLLFENKILEEYNFKKGLHKIELINEPDSIGSSFYFKLNGKPVFMKGANWIPADNFIPRISDEKYELLLLKAKEANFNMMRVFGGGIYETEKFYELCDKFGILVWQDFMFAISMYPGDKKFIENVKFEAIDNVKRLRNFTCLALWCGNNEVDEGWKNWGWQKQFNYSKQESTKIWSNYKNIFHETLKKVVDSLDTAKPYWPSSPLFGWGRKESLTNGDMHYWGVWWGELPFDFYNKNVGRFMSEYGFQGMPNYNSIQKYIPKKEMYFGSRSMITHQKHPVGDELIKKYMARDFNIPDKFENYIYLSQVLQAGGIKTAILTHRRSKPICMGTLFWQFNDCWPVTSWSAIDYYNSNKALYYAVKRSFADVIFTSLKNQNSHKFYLISDLQKHFATNIEIKIIDLSGKNLWFETIELKANPNSSNLFYSLPDSFINKFNRKNIALVCKFMDKQLSDPFIYYFNAPKNLNLKKPNVKIVRNNFNSFTITTNTLTKNIYLFAEDIETEFSDNYFDLLPGEKKIVTLNSNISTEKIKYKSLADNY